MERRGTMVSEVDGTTSRQEVGRGDINATKCVSRRKSVESWSRKRLVSDYVIRSVGGSSMFPCECLDGDMPTYGFEIVWYYLMLRCRSTLRSIQVRCNCSSLQPKYNETDGIKTYLTPRYDYIIRESQYRLKTAIIANPNPYPMASALSLSRSSAMERDFWIL